MALPTPKELKQLADACRKAGIQHFKCGDIEFTLAEAPPVSPYKRRKGAAAKPDHGPQGDVESDSLTEEEALFWSAGGGRELDVKGSDQ